MTEMKVLAGIALMGIGGGAVFLVRALTTPALHRLQGGALLTAVAGGGLSWVGWTFGGGLMMLMGLGALLATIAQQILTL